MPFHVTMPKLSPTMTEGVIARWHKKPGDFVEAGELLLEISTDKATLEHSALDEGFLRKILCQEGEKAQVNDPLAIFTEKPDESIEGFGAKAAPQATPVATAAVQTAAPVQTVQAAKPTTAIFASPLAKKLAKEQGINLQNVAGSGPRGRIMSRDLTNVIPATTTVTETPSITTEEALSPMRQVIGKRLQESKSLIPHFYVRQAIDASPIVAMREELKRLELSYTINDFIIKATACALKKHPEINCGFNEKTLKMIRFAQVDISMAVTIAGGLITPIIHNASTKSLKQLSQEAKQLATKAKEGKLAPHEYQGGSFTISNLGMFGINEMTAIVNPPQGAILGVGAAVDAPMVKDGAIVVGKRLVLTLSCDHRIIDGAQAANFMRTLKEYLENPVLFLAE